MAWFVPAISILYIIFPFYYNKLFKKATNKYSFTIVFILCYLLLVVILSKFIRYDFFSFINRVPVFLVGVLFGWMSKNNKRINTKINPLLVFIFIIGVVLLYLPIYEKMNILIPRSNCLIPTFIIATSLPFLLARGLDLLKNSIFIKPITFYGTISLELYLFQETIAKRIVKHINLRNIFDINIYFGVFCCNMLNLLISTILALSLFLINKHFWIIAERYIYKKKKTVTQGDMRTSINSKSKE